MLSGGGRLDLDRVCEKPRGQSANAVLEMNVRVAAVMLQHDAAVEVRVRGLENSLSSGVLACVKCPLGWVGGNSPFPSCKGSYDGVNGAIALCYR